eukprot:gene27981-36852_t
MNNVSISREPFKVLNENTISPARIRNKSKTHANNERNATSKSNEDEKIHVIQYKNQKFEPANTNKSLAMSLAFSQALVVVQNRRIESLRKKLAFEKIVNFARSMERSTHRNSRSAEKIIITPKKRRLHSQDAEEGLNIPESSEKITKHDISPLNFERLKISDNYIAASTESSLGHKLDENRRRIDYESEKDDEETRRNTWRNGQHFSSYNAARRSPPPASIPIDFSTADTPDRSAQHHQRNNESIPTINSIRRGSTEANSAQGHDPFANTHKVLPHQNHPPPLHPAIKNQTRPPKYGSAPSQHHNPHSNNSCSHLPQSSSASSQHSRSHHLPTADDNAHQGCDHMQNPAPSTSSKPDYSIPASWSQSQAFYSTSSSDSAAIPALRHEEFRAVVSQATTHSMKTLLKDTLLRETTDIQRSLKQYHTSTCKVRVAAAVHSTTNPIVREADISSSTSTTTTTPTASSSSTNAFAIETAIHNFHSVDSRLLPLSALGQQSRLPLYELSTLQEKMQAWRGKYSSPMKSPIIP